MTQQPTLRITEYTPAYKNAFKELNEEWITQYFEMEANDYRVLDHPEETILADDGHILVALLNEKPVGVCALIRHKEGNYPYELGKMAVTPAAQGLQIGFKLASFAIELLRQKGIKSIYLESNTRLTPAINLYRKLGFVEIENTNPHYDRVDIQMALTL